MESSDERKKPKPSRRDRRTPAEIAIDRAKALLREHYGDMACILVGEQTDPSDGEQMSAVTIHPCGHESAAHGLVNDAYGQL